MLIQLVRAYKVEYMLREAYYVSSN